MIVADDKITAVQTALEKFISVVEVLIRVIALSVMTLVAVLAVWALLVWLQPMSYWVHYKRIDVLPDPSPHREFIRVHREVKHEGAIYPIRRYVELHEDAPGMKAIQHCGSSLDTTVEWSTNPYITWDLVDFVGQRCADVALPEMHGRIVIMQVVYSLPRMFGITKTTLLNVGPLIICNGVLLDVKDQGRSCGKARPPRPGDGPLITTVPKDE